MAYDIQVGEIIAVSQNPDQYGDYHPTLSVQSFMDGGLLQIYLTPATWEQSLPVEGNYVCFIRFENNLARILKVWGNDTAPNRAGNKFGLFPGEVFIQSATGYGYLKIDRYGQITLTTGDQISDIQLNKNGIQANTNQLLINTQAGLIFEFSQDGEMFLQKLSPDGSTIDTQLSIDKEANFFISSSKDVSIKATNIYLDGTVWCGQGASDSETRTQNFGDAVSGGALGTSPLTPAPGSPLLGSSSVKVAK